MSARLLGLVKDTVLLNLGRTTPFRVTLMVSEECPLRCATCGIWRRDDPCRPRLEDLERFFHCNRSLSWINLTGGEIFMREDTAEILRIIAAEERRLALLNFPTSGQHPDRILAAVEEGLSAGLERIAVTVSFDGGESSHDRLRGKAGAFEKARFTFHGLREMSGASGGRLGVFPGLTLSAELLRLAPAPLEDLARDLELEGTGEIHVNLAHTSNHYYANSSLKTLPREHLEDALLTARNGRHARNGRRVRSGDGATRPGRGSSCVDLMEKIYLGLASVFLASGRTPLPCKALRASVFVDAGLTVYPCTVFGRNLGSLRDSDFRIDALRASPQWSRARAEIDAGGCPGCWTPCEAYTAVLGNILRPGIARIVRAAAGNGRNGS
jgi:MoaA/NifB/PqqE/SkfB family radical SAM enzyme